LPWLTSQENVGVYHRNQVPLEIELLRESGA
jgi:hypothetical protein